MPDEMVSIGKISSTYGFEGMVKVLPLTDFPERFNSLQKIKISRSGNIQELAVEKVVPYKNIFLLKLAGIDNKEKAAEYRGSLLMVGEDEVFPLPEGYFYHFQLIGMQVYDQEKGLLGQLKEIIETGANDVYVVQGEKYGEILIPAIKKVILDVDTAQNKMQVKLLPGLIEE
ncbi:MAG TPA: ribosome maturation factor RimM [Syntrophomonadaceae bacterium]|nr:ribosome maturation factor RimM [Syntrophomonadaceae bacterium]